MDRDRQRQIVEALILAAPEPVSAAKLAGIVPGLKPGGVKALVAELGEAYAAEGRAFEIWEVAGGYQMRTRPEFSGYVRELHQERPARVSRAALETLAVIAYKQPVTRAEIEHVRGVDVGAVVRSLLDRKLVKVAGHRDVPGRPMLYGTTRRFLELFGLERLDDLPTLREIDELVPAGASDGAGEGEGEDEGSASVPEAADAVDEGAGDEGAEAAPSPDEEEAEASVPPSPGLH